MSSQDKSEKISAWSGYTFNTRPLDWITVTLLSVGIKDLNSIRVIINDKRVPSSSRGSGNRFFVVLEVPWRDASDRWMILKLEEGNLKTGNTGERSLSWLQKASATDHQRSWIFGSLLSELNSLGVRENINAKVEETNLSAVFKWLSQIQYQSLRPITKGASSTMNQSEFLAVTSNLLKAWEKARVQGAIGMSLVSHGMKNSR